MVVDQQASASTDSAMAVEPGQSALRVDPGAAATSTSTGRTALGARPGTLEVKFDGASSAAADTVLEKHVCSFCNKGFDHPSWIGFLQDSAPDYPWVHIKDLSLDNTFHPQLVQDHFQGNLRASCPMCAGEKHKEEYHKKMADGTLKYTAKWTRLKAKSRGMKLSPSHRDAMLDLHDVKTKRSPDLPTSKDIYNANKNQLLRRACDWVTQLGPRDEAFLWLLYGCKSCEHWTINSGSWFRMQRNVRTLKNESSSSGSDEGHWRCAGCFDKWSWALCGHMRMVIVGRATEEFGFSEPPRFAYIGQADAGIDNKVAFLRTAALLTELEGKPVTASSLLGALEVLNARVEAKFSRGLAEMTLKYSMKPEPWQLEQSGTTVVCEDPRLSLAGFGVPYKVIDKQLIKQEVVTIDNAELHFLLDIASSAYVVEDSCPTGAATNKT